MAEPIDNLLNIIINETDTKFVEELPKRPNAFQRNYLSNNAWWALKGEKTLSIGSMDFLEMPSGPSLHYAIQKLNTLGMIDDNYTVTVFGFLANMIRFIPIETKKMIFAGFATGACIFDLITITAFIYTNKRIIFGKKFKIPNLIKRDDYQFIHNILIGDDLINCIFIWNAFHEWIDQKISKIFKKKGDVPNDAISYVSTSDIKEWCVEMGLVYDGFVAMIRNRDTIIENLLSIGINIYYNSLDIEYNKYNLTKIFTANLVDGLSEIKKLKQAIYYGFYLNLCEWNPIKRTYILVSKNIPIATKSASLPFVNSEQAKQSNPKYIIVSQYMLVQSMAGANYEFSCSEYVSVMDNYIDIDPKLGLN